MRLSDMQTKDIVNITNGKKIGILIDLRINPKDGCIVSIIVEQDNKLISIFKQPDEIEIYYDKIIKIGEDVIIVDYPYPTCNYPINP